MNEPISYKPSGYYYRRALRQTNNPDELRAIGLAIVAEQERLKEWVRELGYIPPKWTVPREEAEEKQWGQVS